MGSFTLLIIGMLFSSSHSLHFNTRLNPSTNWVSARDSTEIKYYSMLFHETQKWNCADLFSLSSRHPTQLVSILVKSQTLGNLITILCCWLFLFSSSFYHFSWWVSLSRARARAMHRKKSSPSFDSVSQLRSAQLLHQRQKRGKICCPSHSTGGWCSRCFFYATTTSIRVTLVSWHDRMLLASCCHNTHTKTEM